MEEQTIAKIMSLARIWWFGPLSGAVIAIGLTNIVGVCLSLLYYLSNLSTISLNLILVLFSVAMLLFANMMVMLAGVKSRQQFLIPWLAITSLSIVAAVVYSALNWDEIIEYRVPLVASIILSVYFLAVVSSYYHELVAPSEIIKMKEKAAVSPVVVFSDKNSEAKIIAEEDTVLVALESVTPPPPRHPLPDEVIMITETDSTNPFLTDVFQQKKTEDQETNKTIEAGKIQPPKLAMNKEINLKANFTPFKKSKIGEKTPAKMNIFLPGSGGDGDESDFDFSFNQFDSSLCAETHQGVEENW